MRALLHTEFAALLARAGVSSRRAELYRSKKLIFAKMASRCEAMFDSDGEFASLNTNCLYNMTNGTSLAYMAGYCNSSLFMFLYTQFFGALRMSGGYYQFQAPQLRVMPFRQPAASIDAAVAKLVGRILSAKSDDSDADTTSMERQVDSFIYQVYGLTPSEIAIVERDTSKQR